MEELAVVNRLEVIDETGRVLIKWVEEPFQVNYSIQDDGKTLKIFLSDL